MLISDILVGYDASNPKPKTVLDLRELVKKVMRETGRDPEIVPDLVGELTREVRLRLATKTG